EVQFDYVRFPDEPRSRMATAIFPARPTGQLPREAIRRQVRVLAGLVKPLGVPVTFDVFGLTASVSGDLGIGQVWEDFSDVADVVLPMVYPSHYSRGAFGILRPNAHPYRVVRLALIDALARSRAPNAAQIRPFLQAFTLGRRRPRYTAFEIREQIRAASDLGIESWVLWNPRSVYHRAALPPYPSGTGRAAASGGE
ncbi:MAG: putative glycoside hydrolase, partial [Gemmatimonadales bacterium]